jgi:hypothetical protein
MQKFMDKEECKNFLVTKHNLHSHSFISMKFSSGCDKSPIPWGMWQFFHEHLLAMICLEDAHLVLISGYNYVTSQHTYIGAY